MAYAWKFGTADARNVIDDARRAIKQRGGTLPVSLVVADARGILAGETMDGAEDGFATVVERARGAGDPNLGGATYSLQTACKTFRKVRLQRPKGDVWGRPANSRRPYGCWLGRVVLIRNGAVVGGLAVGPKRPHKLLEPCDSILGRRGDPDEYDAQELIYSIDLGRWPWSIWSVQAQLATLVWLEVSYFTHLPHEEPVLNPVPAATPRRRGRRGGRRGRAIDPGQLITDEFRLFMQNQDGRDDGLGGPR